MWSCMMNVRFSVLISGRPLGKILASRDLREGDALSPFLFTQQTSLKGCGEG